MINDLARGLSKANKSVKRLSTRRDNLIMQVTQLDKIARDRATSSNQYMTSWLEADVLISKMYKHVHLDSLNRAIGRQAMKDNISIYRYNKSARARSAAGEDTDDAQG